MKINKEKEVLVFDNLGYGDVFSFSQFGNNAVYIKIRDSTDISKCKAVDIENGDVICLGGLEPVMKHDYEMLIK